MDKLTVGQRIDVYEILSGYGFAPKQVRPLVYTSLLGNVRLKFINEDPDFEYFFYQHEVKKVGTFIVKSLKGARP